MVIYTSFDELNGKTLQTGDRVFVLGCDFEARIDYMHCRTGDNDKIFDELGIDQEWFLTSTYGHKPDTGGCWHNAKEDEAEALTRTMLVLLAFAESRDVWIEMPNGTWKEFKVNDWIENLQKLQHMVIAKVFKVGDYKATVGKDRVEAGCQVVSFKEVEAVYNFMKSLRG